MKQNAIKPRVMKQSGFTLIELLVVVAIISVIASIAVPMFSSYKKRTYDSVALTDLKNNIAVIESYLIDNPYDFSSFNCACNGNNSADSCESHFENHGWTGCSDTTSIYIIAVKPESEEGNYAISSWAADEDEGVVLGMSIINK